MEQTKKVIKETWNLADLALEEKNHELRRKCLNDIANYAVLLNRFHDFLPAICSMKLFDNELVPSVRNMDTQVNQIAKLSWPPNKKIHKRIIGG
jgi:alpha-mannosidase